MPFSQLLFPEWANVVCGDGLCLEKCTVYTLHSQKIRPLVNCQQDVGQGQNIIVLKRREGPVQGVNPNISSVGLCKCISPLTS